MHTFSPCTICLMLLCMLGHSSGQEPKPAEEIFGDVSDLFTGPILQIFYSTHYVHDGDYEGSLNHILGHKDEDGNSITVDIFDPDAEMPVTTPKIEDTYSIWATDGASILTIETVDYANRDSVTLDTEFTKMLKEREQEKVTEGDGELIRRFFFMNTSTEQDPRSRHLFMVTKHWDDLEYTPNIPYKDTVNIAWMLGMDANSVAQELPNIPGSAMMVGHRNPMAYVDAILTSQETEYEFVERFSFHGSYECFRFKRVASR